MLDLDQAFSSDIAAAARDWFRRWQLESVSDDLKLRFSRRMVRSVGRCYPQRREVAFAAGVKALEAEPMLGILCHEFAHIAAYEHYGSKIRPHGPEWQGLVRTVGFIPSVRFADEQSLAILAAHGPRRRHYLHRCPNCRAERVSSRRMQRWRCGACYEIGRDGLLEILELS